MKKTVGYYLLMAVTWPMQFLPLSFHYLVSDLFYFLVYHVAGYRKKVVEENLAKSFPEKTEKERKTIERKFYRNFADLFIETLYFTHTPYRKMEKRLTLENIELVEQLLSEGKNVILLSGHLGNWEFFQLFKIKLDAQKFFVYKRLGNKTFDQYYKQIRSKTGIALEMSETFRTLYSYYREGKKYSALFISDQRPWRDYLKHWVTFMNQDTPVLTGTERIAKKTNAAVVYTEITSVKRGYQRFRFELIARDANAMPEFEITHTFMQKLEQSIRKYPDQYFWTHKRWKYKREKN